ncbi:N-terminal phage integrase SAM-like domain-containing protein [Streptosporangium lutulentum]
MTRTALGTPEEGPRRQSKRRMRKRSNGEGSIWPRKDGRYGYAAFVPTTGGAVKRVQGSARSQEDARKKLTELLKNSDEGIPVSSENWTVGDYLNYWLKYIVREERRPKTYQGYEGVVRLHLIPGLGKRRLSNSTPRRSGCSLPGPVASASAASTAGTPPGRLPSAARSRTASAASHGYRLAWSSPCTPYSATPWSPRYERRSSRATRPSSSRSRCPSTRSTAA